MAAGAAEVAFEAVSEDHCQCDQAETNHQEITEALTPCQSNALIAKRFRVQKVFSTKQVHYSML